ncbi:MAG: crossover junction endodeoxyribonuclease RuvC [Chloroflexi bacterium]|nr:crossover junction endodeoxyribonuclease RuvC [Chloroflexota bacterium]
MRVLGIDPGTATLGYGVIDGAEPLRAVAFGAIRTSASEAMPRRLLRLHHALLDLLQTHQPEVVAVEQLFHARNTTTSITVGQARGVVLLAAAESDLEVVEYSPMQVKQSVVGYGGADKHQVQAMVRLLLGLDSLPQPDDAADALAVAICHQHTARFTRRLTPTARP